MDTAFNATIELVQGEERTMVGRSVFYSMDANTAKSVKRSFTAPEGDWTLEITVDQEGHVWEIDETNNVWSRTVSGSSSAFGATTVMLGGGAILALIGATVFLRRRAELPVEQEKVVAALEATDASHAASQTTAKPPAQPPAKKRGPPGAKIAAHQEKHLSQTSKGRLRPNPRRKTNLLPKNEQPCTWRHWGLHQHRHHRLKTGRRLLKPPGGGNMNTRQKACSTLADVWTLAIERGQILHEDLR